MARSLQASIDIAATPDRVWAVVSDLPRMKEWSPQCRWMRVSGPVGAGTKTINLNRRGPLVWPTTSKVVRYEPNKVIAFRITENRSVWSYELEANHDGTTLTERRESPNGTSKVSGFLIDKFMGGTDSFDDELVVGMNETLTKIRAAVEQR